MLADQTEASGELRSGHRPSFVGREQGLIWICMRSQLKVLDHGGQRTESKVSLSDCYG